MKKKEKTILYKKYQEEQQKYQEIENVRAGLETDSEIVIKKVSTAGKVMELFYRVSVNVLKVLAYLLIFGLASFGLTILVNTSLREAVWELLRQMI